MGRDLHLIPEAHVVLDVLPGHADVVGDLVDLVALLGARQDAGAAQAVDGRMVGVVGLDVPIVLLDLGGNPFFPAATYLPAFRGVGKPATPTRAPSKATRSTRSPTTSACPGRTSSTTCASRIRCRSRPKGKSGFGWSRTKTRPRTFGRLYHRCQTPDLENSLAILENFRKKCCKFSHFGGEWCNGSTTDSDSVCLGSNPSSPVTPKPLKTHTFDQTTALNWAVIVLRWLASEPPHAPAIWWRAIISSARTIAE